MRKISNITQRVCFGSLFAASLWMGASAHAQVNIPETFRKDSSAADKSKPGFLWNVFQNSAEQSNNNTKTENALAGLLKDSEGNFLVNQTDPGAQGAANGPGKKLGSFDNSLIQFEVSGVINFDQGGGSNGSITPDEQMPGIPGLEGSTDGIAAEALAWLDLPAGETTLIVNSDDGFTLTIGGAGPKDQFGKFVGEFNGGRGASDTAMTISVPKAGLYAARVTWQEGGGGANIEFVHQKADGTKVAVNSADTTIKAYRAVTGAAGTIATRVVPGPGSTTASFDTPIEVVLQNAAVTTASIKLSVDGVAVTPTVSKDGENVTIKYQPTGRFAPRSKHTVSLEFNDGTAQKRDWDFTVVSYALLTAADKVTADTGKPGFIWNVHQNEAFQANDNVRTDQQLAGLLGVNKANPDNIGVALAAGKKGATDRLPISFEIPGVINLDQAGGSNGEFTPDEQMPGIPGTSENADGIAAEILTYIELPAGVHTFIVNSDDGFETKAGNIRDIFLAQKAGEFIGGRGASDTSYRIVVQDAGVYPFRTSWEEGGGGANIEWKTVKADGTRVLVNDVANGGFKAYRVSTTGLPTAVSSVTPAIGAAIVDPATEVSAQITEGTTAVDTASVKLSVDGADVAATVTKSGSVITAKYQPAKAFEANSSHTAVLTFKHGTATRTETWTFKIPQLTKDKIGSLPGFLTGIAKFTGDAGGVSAKAGDYGMDLGRAGSTVFVEKGGFFNTAAADDKVTVSAWMNRYDVSDGSLFWANSTSSSGSTRGFQAHAPWGDNTIYFDTAGCCAGGTQRNSANISTFPSFTAGDNTWWYTWRHYAFVKDGATKRIYIDGELFLEGDGTADPLPQDFTTFVIGGGPGTGDNRTHAVIDDFAVHNGALSAADVKRIATKGTLPSAVSGLVAYWDFNDAPAPVSNVKLSVTRNGANLTITSEPAALPAGWVLQTASKVDGPWATQAGASTPVTVPIGTGEAYLRAIKP